MTTLNRPQPPFPTACAAWEEEVEELGAKQSSCAWEEGGCLWGKVFFVLTLLHTILLYFWMATNKTNIPQAESVLPVMVIGEQSPRPYLDPQAFLFRFLLLWQHATISYGSHKASKRKQKQQQKHFNG